MSTPAPLPFERTYWAVAGRVMGGPYPGHPQLAAAQERLAALLQCGIRSVVNLMETDEVNHQGLPFAPYIEEMRVQAAPTGEPITWARHPIRDVSIPTRQEMQTILDTIDSALQANQPVYVHCWGGKGRTGTVIGCYMIRHGIASPADALETINQLRRDIRPYQSSPETYEQCDFVRDWRLGQ